MSCYTLFKGWLPPSPPIGFFALPVCTRPLLFDSVTFPLVLKYVGSRKLGHAVKCDMPLVQKLINQFNSPLLNKTKVSSGNGRT